MTDDDPGALADAELHTIVRLAAALLEAPCATANILGVEEQCQLATHGFVGGSSPRTESLCHQTRGLTEGVFACADLREDPRFATNPWVDGRRGHVRGYASAPLRVDGAVIGTLCVFDPEPHEFSALDLRRLADLAEVVVALLERVRQSRLVGELAAQLARARAFDQALLDALPVGVVAADAEGRLQLVNRVSRSWHGAAGPEDVLGAGVARHLGLYGPDATTLLRDEELPLTRVLRGESVGEVEVVAAAGSGPGRRLSVTGAPIHGPDGELLGGVVTMADITRQRQLEDQLRAEALHDTLTGLPHRGLLVDRVRHGLQGSVRSGTPVAVLFCDLDGFKAVNDSWGHAAGDAVLRETARRLQTAVRPGDTVGRLGGDEFLVVCPDVPTEAAAAVVAERIERAVGAPLVVDGGPAGGVEVRVGVSVGAALSRPGDAPETLLTRADEAMYRVKRDHHLRVVG
ncbi:diguanylate cyclase domain-containing protein [Geodermatophilus sp. SYSU D00079]